MSRVPITKPASPPPVFRAPAPSVPVAPPAPPPPPRPRTFSLTNRVKGTRSFNLTHEAMCADAGACVCKPVVAAVVKVAKGSRQVGITSRTINCPEPLTLLAGETRKGLPESILACPEIAKAVADRRLIATKE